MSPALTWFLVGMAFLFAELALPGFVIIFFGLGAWITALAVLIWPMGLAAQIMVFTAASLATLFGLRRWLKPMFSGAETDPGLDDAGVGQPVAVTKTVRGAVAGEVKYRGSFWQAVAEDGESVIEAGEEAVITGRAKNRHSVLTVARYTEINGENS